MNPQNPRTFQIFQENSQLTEYLIAFLNFQKNQHNNQTLPDYLRDPQNFRRNFSIYLAQNIENPEDRAHLIQELGTIEDQDLAEVADFLVQNRIDNPEELNTYLADFQEKQKREATENSQTTNSQDSTNSFVPDVENIHQDSVNLGNTLAGSETESEQNPEETEDDAANEETDDQLNQNTNSVIDSDQINRVLKANKAQKADIANQAQNAARAQKLAQVNQIASNLADRLPDNNGRPTERLLSSPNSDIPRRFLGKTTKKYRQFAEAETTKNGKTETKAVPVRQRPIRQRSLGSNLNLRDRIPESQKPRTTAENPNNNSKNKSQTANPNTNPEINSENNQTAKNQQRGQAKQQSPNKKSLAKTLAKMAGFGVASGTGLTLYGANKFAQALDILNLF